MKRQDSVREEGDANHNELLQEVRDTTKTIVNGFGDSVHSVYEGSDNVTRISVDCDPAANSKQASIGQEQEEKSIENGATEVVHACDESNMFVVEEQSTEFCYVETVVEERSIPSSESSVSDDVVRSVACTEAVVQDSVTCVAELAEEDMQICELVECAETSSEDFQVATVVENDDIVSVCSLGSSENIVQMHEIVMETGKQLVEEVPMCPMEKALIRRGYDLFVWSNLSERLFIMRISQTR